jgi:hypothetical protein
MDSYNATNVIIGGNYSDLIRRENAEGRRRKEAALSSLCVLCGFSSIFYTTE